MPLCDLLPTAYQSLISSLYLLNTGKIVPYEYLNDCDALLTAIEKDPQLCQSLPGKGRRIHCFCSVSFVLGLSIWSGISSLSSSLDQIANRLKFLDTVAPPYNRKHLFVRRYELDSRLTELNFLQNDLYTTTQVLNRHFTELYSLDVIDEWFDLYVTPVLARINSTLIDFSLARNQTSWPRRPLI